MIARRVLRITGGYSPFASPCVLGHWRQCASTASDSKRVAVQFGRRTYFDVLSTRIGAEISPAQLRERYHALQARVHPDQAKGVEDATEQSAVASKAYGVLKDDYMRCRYLSQLLRNARAGTLQGSSAVAGDCVEMALEDASAKMDREFLSDVMSLNIEVNTLDHDDPEGKEELMKIRDRVLHRCESYWQRCRDLFKEHGDEFLQSAAKGAAAPPPSVMELAFHATLQEWTYFNNLKKQIYDKIGSGSM